MSDMWVAFGSIDPDHEAFVTSDEKRAAEAAMEWSRYERNGTYYVGRITDIKTVTVEDTQAIIEVAEADDEH